MDWIVFAFGAGWLVSILAVIVGVVEGLADWIDARAAARVSVVVRKVTKL